MRFIPQNERKKYKRKKERWHNKWKKNTKKIRKKIEENGSAKGGSSLDLIPDYEVSQVQKIGIRVDKGWRIWVEWVKKIEELKKGR